MVSPRAEWEFVLHTANLYERMGCDLLALDLGMPISHSHFRAISQSLFFYIPIAT